ncbi:CinA family protein [Nesterenkonia pannonica]|uniref:CinA family protein n=1 Tax=Nesterenkonia pannonica TaxID=1548602 RepID=UPI002164D9D7|nr:CinA family protein [Nesterenkonia pannonica]
MQSVERLEAEASEVVADVGAVLAEWELTVAVAESLTGGKIANQCAAAKGSGDWFAGGVVAYHSDAKHRVLGSRKDQ